MNTATMPLGGPTIPEGRRMFNLHVRVKHSEAFHRQWPEWRRSRQAAVRKLHYARRTRNHKALL